MVSIGRLNRRRDRAGVSGQSAAIPVCATPGQDAGWTFRTADVTKVYPNGVRANDSISLHVAPGEVYGLLGPNGAWQDHLGEAGHWPAPADRRAYHARPL